MNNKRGFSLVELMIVVALLGGVSLVVMNLTKQSSKSSAKYQFDTEINLITSEINAILSNPNICKATFQANNLTPSNINLKYYSNASAPAKGYGNAGVHIASYNLAQSTLPGATANDAILTILFKNKNIVGGVSTPRTINIYYEGALTALTACRSLSTSTTDIWSHGTGANAHDIFFSDGYVGIGTTVPGASLEIAGGVLGAGVGNQVEIARFRNTNANANNLRIFQNRFSNGSDWSTAETRIQQRTDVTEQTYISFSPDAGGGMALGTGSPASEKVRISPTGNVGIKTIAPGSTLHVNGNITSAIDDGGTGFVQLWSDNALIWRSGNGNGGLRFGNASNLSAASWSEKMRIADGGNVGIGNTNPAVKLEVSGSIRPSAETLGAGCSPIGAQAYNASTGEPVYCNGSVWTAVGGSSGGWTMGGLYTRGNGGSGCDHVNPITGGYNCPAGYNDSIVHNSYYAWGACPNVQYYLHLCWK